MKHTAKFYKNGLPYWESLDESGIGYIAFCDFKSRNVVVSCIPPLPDKVKRIPFGEWDWLLNNFDETTVNQISKYIIDQRSE